MFASAACALLLALLAISITVFHVSQNGKEVEVLETAPSTTSLPYDPRSTLEIIQERGYIICGMTNRTIESTKGFYWDLVCLSILSFSYSFVSLDAPRDML